MNSAIKQSHKLQNISLVLKRCCASVIKEEQIIIPARIPREPTDILRALSSTVARDSTASHYKYHDDPYLIPTSNVGKRTFAMAQEAGRKAARWVRQENPRLFQHMIADPPIKAFFPQVVFNENSEVEVGHLENCIRDVQISDAVLVYNLLKTKGVEVPQPVVIQLLQLICFYNNEDSVLDEWIEERWFMQSASGKDRQRKTWKDGDFAEQLFNEIEPKDAVAYATIIRGMAKFFQVEKAWALFQEATNKGIQLDVATYNSILQISCFIKENGEQRWEHTQEVLRLMASNNLKPNLETLNAVLSTISSIGIYKSARDYALKTLAEFKALNITPSLGSWYYILIIFCRDRCPVSHVLVDILKEIENQEFKIQDIRDTFFFVTAMDVCRNHLHDKDIARRVDSLLHFRQNYDLIGDSYKESIYYRNFLTLLCQSEPLDKFMNEAYNVLVPNVYIPEPGVIDEILKSIDTNGALSYIPKIWSDMIIFDQINRENLVNSVLKIMVDNTPNAEILDHANLGEKFSEIAWSIWTNVENQPENRMNKLTWSGEMIGSVLELCGRFGDIEKCHTIFDKIDKTQHKIVGAPSVNSLRTYIELCVTEKQPSKAIACLQYCSENMLPETEEYGRLISEQMTLNEVQTSKLESIVGVRSGH